MARGLSQCWRGGGEGVRLARLSPEEQLEWERIDYIEHLVRIAKAKAAMKLKDR